MPTIHKPEIKTVPAEKIFDLPGRNERPSHVSCSVCVRERREMEREREGEREKGRKGGRGERERERGGEGKVELFVR